MSRRRPDEFAFSLRRAQPPGSQGDRIRPGGTAVVEGHVDLAGVGDPGADIVHNPFDE